MILKCLIISLLKTDKIYFIKNEYNFVFVLIFSSIIDIHAVRWVKKCATGRWLKTVGEY